ncbi:MAG: hypothetical protein HGB12_00045 [Bacteroidetes bacterium]|nr:hypothetical protein [Bacteroidota bacterium]
MNLAKRPPMADHSFSRTRFGKHLIKINNNVSKTKTPYALCLRHRLMPYAFFIALYLFLTFHCFSQGISINTTGNEADNSAALDISSTTQGVLIPRMTTTQRDLITSPAAGLIIFNITTNCFEAYVNGAWNTVSCPAACTPPTQPSIITGLNSVCQSQSNVSYSVTNVSGVTYTWTYSGTGFNYPLGYPSNSITANFITATSGTLTVTPSNTCGNGTPQTLTITINAAPTSAAAGTDINPAGGVSIATLAGNTPTVGTGLWSVVSGTATITTPNSPTSGVTGLEVPGVATLRWTISNSTCTASTDDVVITTTAFTCDNIYAVSHTIGTVSPETKTVNYGTVTTSLSGASKCWITQNLGSNNQASSATDASEASAGWYWQFNRKQGYKHDGSTRTPSTTWITSINETSDWLPVNDPCKIELGNGWRIPTQTEWTAADGSPQNWSTYTDTYNSVLKLHAAGYLTSGDGSLSLRGNYGFYWSSSQYDATYGWLMRSYSAYCGVYHDEIKAIGNSIRCIKDNPTPAFSCGNALPITHTLGIGVAPVTKTVNYGTVTTSLSGASKCWITQNLGADQQATSAATDLTDASAGWYWQFNRKQGYKVGSTPTWTISISEASDWLPINDPCTSELGSGWRIPSFTEWTNVVAGWPNYTDIYNSVLKIHGAGTLRINGVLEYRGYWGYYWGSTQNSASNSWLITFDGGPSHMVSYEKAFGASLRCLKD